MALAQLLPTIGQYLERAVCQDSHFQRKNKDMYIMKVDMNEAVKDAMARNNEFFHFLLDI